MTIPAQIGDGEAGRLTPDGRRAAVLGEVHARPFALFESPRRLIHFAFLTNGEQAKADITALQALCAARGAAQLPEGAKHHVVSFATTRLRWEQHGEFTTYGFDMPADSPLPFHPPARALASPMGLVPQPGALLVALDIHLLPAGAPEPDLEQIFDDTSLAVSQADGGSALVASDFRVDTAGFVRMLVIDRGLSPARAGALLQRLVEIETYRTLALLGLPEAQRISPRLVQHEMRASEITEEMRVRHGLADNQRLLDDITALAAEAEADAASSAFRFGASRAYSELVTLRLEAIRETSVPKRTKLSNFLTRRMAPAMRTCQTVVTRQVDLTAKLSRASSLLRTRVDIEMQQVNRDLLHSMNERTRLQLRLQQTVEGLSVAAISYYVVGLVGYIAKGAKDAGLPVDPGVVTAAAVPFALLVFWWLMRRIRSAHGGDH